MNNPGSQALHTHQRPSGMPVVALVDDDRNILASVSMVLEAEGFVVETYVDGESALKALSRRPPDIVVLDIQMPRMDGMELLVQLRRKGSLPVIFLTSRDDEVDEILGLRMGADDYICKPFSQRLLIARIRAVLRRHNRVMEEEEAYPSEPPLIRGNLRLDFDRFLCTWKGQNVGLTVTEFMILRTLVQHLGHVKSRDQLMDVAYGDSVYVVDRSIDSHIKRLRKKFREVDSEFREIETMYGIGYRYREP